MRGRAIPPPLVVVRVAAHVAVIVVAAYAASRVLEVASTRELNFVVWLLAGAVLHDAILLPLYTVADIVARIALGEHPLRRVPAINHVRVPAAVSGVLLLVYFPSIFGLGTENFVRVSGREPANDPLEAWLWITAAAFAVSAAAYAARLAFRNAEGRITDR